MAPEADRSGASNSLTLDRPLYVRQSANGFYYVNGTPTDCVHVAVTGFLNERPDLVVSGINNGQNVAEDTLYSGTVAAAMEGFLLGIPAVAFSLADRGFGQLDTAVHVAQRVVAGLIRRPFSGPCLLNVNIPNVSLGDLKGYRVCRLGRRHVAQPVLRVSSPRGEPMYWVGRPGPSRRRVRARIFMPWQTGKSRSRRFGSTLETRRLRRDSRSGSKPFHKAGRPPRCPRSQAAPTEVGRTPCSRSSRVSGRQSRIGQRETEGANGGATAPTGHC